MVVWARVVMVDMVRNALGRGEMIHSWIEHKGEKEESRASPQFLTRATRGQRYCLPSGKGLKEEQVWRRKNQEFCFGHVKSEMSFPISHPSNGDVEQILEYMILEFGARLGLKIKFGNALSSAVR